MDIWKVLDIEKTKDKNEIKRAYREKLTLVNPEDDAQGFMELRRAFDEANNYADEAEEADAETEKTETPSEKLYDTLKELYANFYRRISVDEWRKILNTDYCISLDTSEEALDIILKFISENYQLPSPVFKLLVNQYSIDERKDELSEKYPSDFIDYIINNSIYDDLLDYSLFEGDPYADYDSYINKYYKLESAVRNQKTETQDKLISELSESDVYNPFLDLLKVRNLQQKGENEKAREIIDSLYVKYPDKMRIIICRGDVYLELSDIDTAEKCYEEAFKLNPDDNTTRYKKAEIYLLKNEFEKARDIFIELMKVNHYDNVVIAGLLQANEGIINNYKEKLKENPEDNKIRMEMAWSYYQSYKFAEAVDILDSFKPDSENMCEYNNVKGRSYLCLNDIDEALSCFEIWKKEIEKLDENDDSEETLKKKKRYPYVNFLIGDCYLKKADYEKAEEYIDYALAHEHEEIILSYEAKCELEFEKKNYEKCIEMCNELEKRDKVSYTAHDYKAKSLYEMGMYRGALDVCEKAIRIYPYIINPYKTEIKIFFNVKAYDSVQAVINRYSALDIASDIMKMYSARLLIERDKNYDDAVKMLEEIHKNIVDEKSDVTEKDYDRFYSLWATCYEEKDNKDEAMRIYNELIDIYPETRIGHALLGLIYKEKMMINQAIEQFTIHLEISPDDDYYYFNRGILYKYKRLYKEAKEDFLKAFALNKGNGYILKLLGVTSNIMGDYEEALTYLDKALPVINENYIKEVMLQKALSFECLMRFSDAEKVYLECMEKYDNEADIVIRYSRLLQRMKRIVEAADILAKAKIEDEDDRRSVYYRVLRQALDTGNLEHALKVLARAEKNKLADSSFYSVIAEMYMQKGKYAKAEKYYLQAVEADKNNEDNYYSELAEVASKQFASAGRVQRYIKQCLNRIGNPSTPEDYVALARVERVRKNYLKAREYLNKALGSVRCVGCFYGKCADAYIEMGKLLEAEGKNDEAILSYSQALKLVGYDRECEESLKRLKKK